VAPQSSEFCYSVTPQGGIQLPAGCPHPETAPIAEFADYVRSRINPLLAPAASGSGSPDESASAAAKTWIFPTVQMGRFGIHQDERVTELLLSSCATSGASLDLASAYFNVTKRYKNAILSPHHQAQVNIITASPEVPASLLQLTVANQRSYVPLYLSAYTDCSSAHPPASISVR
jgi:hypothetical protein